MKTHRSLLRPAAAALLAASLLASGWAQADSHARLPEATTEAAKEPKKAGKRRNAKPETIIAQSGDCYAIGERVAAQNGGTLGRATASTQGGQPVCVIVVLVPAKGGQHPRRMEIVVPQN